MVDFEPGDMVECLRDDRAIECPLPDLQVGALYTVLEFLPSEVVIDNDNDAGLELVGATHPDWCYPASYFRKIYRPDPKLIERLVSAPVGIHA